jgi:hypothetical protein
VTTYDSFHVGGTPARRLDPMYLPIVGIALGSALFVVAALVRSLPLTHAAAALGTIGLVGVPVVLAVQGRLSTMPKGRLVLGAVMIAQGLHTIEHLVQIVQSYRLDLPPIRSLGIVSSLNVEWVHFGWNWIAWAGVVIAWRAGVRGTSMVLLFAWITAHSLEHTYMLWHYLTVLRRLNDFALPELGSSQVLPGVFGRDGWLARSFPQHRELLGPFVAAPRVAVHLWWNLGEMAFLTLCVLIGRRPASARP